jgi:hypothetical protein
VAGSPNLPPLALPKNSGVHPAANEIDAFETVCSALNSSASVFVQQKVRFRGGTLNKR